MKPDDSALKIEAGLLSPEDDATCLFSGKKSPSLSSSSIAFNCSSSCCGSASIRPSRIALATPIPLMTATRDRLYRFASTMVWEKTCLLGVDDSAHASDINLYDGAETWKRTI